MLSQSDIQGRLRLFRYGLIVVVVVTFLISLLAPSVSLSFLSSVEGVTVPPITDFLGTAILFTIGAAVVAVIVYSVYHYILTKRWPWAGGDSAGSSSAGS